MTVNVTKPILNIREELKKPPVIRAWREQQFWFGNLVKNGTFTQDTDWTKGTGWTISGGVAIHAAGGSGGLSQITAPPTIGRKYKLVVTIAGRTTGSFDVSYAGASGPLTTTNGSHSFELIAANQGGTVTLFASADFNGNVDDFSLYPIDASGNIIHRLPRGWKPVHVHENGLLRREGSGYDYTTVFDGFDWVVKPTVAPGVSTQTCIIAVHDGVI